MESRRKGVVFLISGAVVIIELKGKERPSQTDIDQEQPLMAVISAVIIVIVLTSLCT